MNGKHSNSKPGLAFLCVVFVLGGIQQAHETCCQSDCPDASFERVPSEKLMAATNQCVGCCHSQLAVHARMTTSASTESKVPAPVNRLPGENGPCECDGWCCRIPECFVAPIDTTAAISSHIATVQTAATGDVMIEDAEGVLESATATTAPTSLSSVQCCAHFCRFLV